MDRNKEFKWSGVGMVALVLIGLGSLMCNGCGSGLGSVFSGEAGFGNFVNGAGLFLPRPVAGEDGQDGMDGADGLDGIDGVAGVGGAEGPEGPQGSPGVDGSDGAQGDRGSPGDTGPPGSCGSGCVTFCHYHETIDDPGDPHNSITGPAIPCGRGR